MKIFESDIDAIHDEMSVKDGLDEKLLDKFCNEQPHITAWLLGDDFGLLTESEQDYLFFLAMVIYESCVRKTGDRSERNGESVREAEEINWGMLEDSSGKSFRDRVTVFFDSSEEEDLLAFIEDSLTEDDDEEEPIVTKIGREPMFVALKSVVDVLLEQ
jgi:hypothetical protein